MNGTTTGDCTNMHAFLSHALESLEFKNSNEPDRTLVAAVAAMPAKKAPVIKAPVKLELRIEFLGMSHTQTIEGNIKITMDKINCSLAIQCLYDCVTVLSDQTDVDLVNLNVSVGDILDRFKMPEWIGIGTLWDDLLDQIEGEIDNTIQNLIQANVKEQARMAIASATGGRAWHVDLTNKNDLGKPCKETSVMSLPENENTKPCCPCHRVSMRNERVGVFIVSMFLFALSALCILYILMMCRRRDAGDRSPTPLTVFMFAILCVSLPVAVALLVYRAQIHDAWIQDVDVFNVCRSCRCPP